MKMATTLLIDEILLKRARQKFGKRKLSEHVNDMLRKELDQKADLRSCAGILGKYNPPPFKRDVENDRQ